MVDPPGRTGTLLSPCLEHSLKRWSQNHSSANSPRPYRWVCGLPEIVTPTSTPTSTPTFLRDQNVDPNVGVAIGDYSDPKLWKFHPSHTRTTKRGRWSTQKHHNTLNSCWCTTLLREYAIKCSNPKNMGGVDPQYRAQRQKTDPNWTYYDCMCPCNVKSMFSNSKASKMNLQGMHYDPNLWPTLC